MPPNPVGVAWSHPSLEPPPAIRQVATEVEANRLRPPPDNPGNTHIDSHIQHRQQIENNGNFECYSTLPGILQYHHEGRDPDGLDHQGRIEHRPKFEIEPPREDLDHEEKRLDPQEDFYPCQLVDG